MDNIRDFFKKIVGLPTQIEIEDFITAAGQGDRVQVENYLSRHGQRHIDRPSKKISSFRNTALIEALYRDKPDMAAFLIEKGANVNVHGEFDTTPLINASDEASVLLLIGKGAEIDARDDIGRTALISATFNRNLPKMALLLKNGADPENSLYWNPKNNLDSTGGRGYTPLMIAASLGHEDSLALLMTFDVRITRNHKGQTALDIARELKESVCEASSIWHTPLRREPCRTEAHDRCQLLMEQYNVQKSAAAPKKGLEENVPSLARLKIKPKGQTP